MVDTYKVTDFMSKVPAFVDPESDLHSVLTKMLKFDLKEIPVIDNHIKVKSFVTKKSIFKYFNRLEKMSISDILDESNSGIIAYPDSDLNEIYLIMTNLGISCIPVVKNPWNKRLMGFLRIKRLEKAFKKNVVIA